MVKLNKKTQAKLLKIIRTTYNDRTEWEDLWTTATFYYTPYKYRTTDKSSSVKLPRDNYSSKPQLAAQTFSAGFFGYLTPLSSLFFGLRKNRFEDTEVKAHKDWLYNAERAVYNILLSSNFSQEIQECYTDYGVNGNPVIFFEEDDEDVVRFESKHILDVAIIENARRKTNGYIERYPLTAAQAFSKWGLDAGKVVQQALKNNEPEKIILYTHLVVERDFYDKRKKDKYNKKFGSYHILLEEDLFVEEGGYSELKMANSKFFKDNRSQYAYGPGIIALADTKMSNSMHYSNAMAAHKMVEPPITYPEGLYQQLDLSPRAINAKAPSTTNEEAKPIHTVTSLPVALEMSDRVVESINQIFYTDLFKMLMNRRNMTATEVQELVSEKAPLLGPAMGRILNSMLSRIIEFTLKTAIAKKVIPPPPKGLETIDVVYTSYLSKAQHSAEVRSVISFFQVIQPLMQVMPEVALVVDMKAGLKDIADKMAVPPSIIRSDEEIAKLEEDIKAQQEVQAKLAAAEQSASAIEKGSKADLNVKKANE